MEIQKWIEIQKLFEKEKENNFFEKIEDYSSFFLDFACEPTLQEYHELKQL